MNEEGQNIVNGAQVANPADNPVEKTMTQPQTSPQQQDNNTKQPAVNQQAIDNSKYQGEIDCLKAQMEEQRKQNDKLQKDYERLLEEQNKNNILNKIKQTGIKPKDEYSRMTTSDIITSFVKENSTINIEGKGKNYIEGVFETICKNKIDAIELAEPESGLAGISVRKWDDNSNKDDFPAFSIVKMREEQEKARKVVNN